MIRVVYSSLNFRDVMLATGKLTNFSQDILRFPQYVPLGLEYAGIDANGQRVMGVRGTE